ncbi:MAG: hypothetical protein R3F60_27440 [bacterium]
MRSGRENLTLACMGAFGPGPRTAGRDAAAAGAPPARPEPGAAEDRRLFVLRAAELARLVAAEQAFTQGERRACSRPAPADRVARRCSIMLLLEPSTIAS